MALSNPEKLAFVKLIDLVMRIKGEVSDEERCYFDEVVRSMHFDQALVNEARKMHLDRAITIASLMTPEHKAKLSGMLKKMATADHDLHPDQAGLILEFMSRIGMD